MRQETELNLDHGMELLKIVREKSAEMSVPLCVAILDRYSCHVVFLASTSPRHANLVLHVRPPGCMLGSVDLAMQKARGSALFPVPTSNTWQLSSWRFT